MLYDLLYPLREWWFGFNVFKYITFRAAMASVTAFSLTLVFGPFIIEMLRRLKVGQHIRREYVEELYQQHKHKAGTPTMGGFMILFSVMLSTLLWARLDNQYVILCLISMLGLGLVGFVDDYIKLIRERNMGLHASAKFIGQLIVAGFVAYYIYRYTDLPRTLTIPFVKDLVLDLGIAYAGFIVLVMVSASNAVNLTDGLDGLAIGCATIIAIAYAIISYVTGNVIAAEYLNVFYLPGAGERCVFCAAIVGSGLGFLWFNS
ncbi:MAG: phospho-N-acetylmuramoyl-pentapeptide-transferase, partial [Candidatus Omnitrophica bacterium]|nr:phospho-N-acetylmuramoyl-pentapeptide-transferase [Candidatus Omnitrophota bacterium]